MHCIKIQACAKPIHNYSIFLWLWHTAWTTHAQTTYKNSMTGNRTTNMVDMQDLALMDINSKVRYPNHSTFKHQQCTLHLCCSAIHSNIFQRAAKKEKGIPTSVFSRKWVLFPDLIPPSVPAPHLSLPLLLLPRLSHLHDIWSRAYSCFFFHRNHTNLSSCWRLTPCMK